MSCTLYSALVPSYLQILHGSLGWLDKAAAFIASDGRSEAELMKAALAPDMLPFNRQVRGFAMHAQGGIEGALSGVFAPDRSPAPTTIAGLKVRVSEAIAALDALDPAAIDGAMGKPMRVDLGDSELKFTTEEFLLSFSQPNFYFHVATAYGILRNVGVQIGKRDYLAGLRLAS